MTGFFRRLTRFRRGQRGHATIEFVILFPFFIGLFSSAFEAGLLTAKQTMLERATDIAVRQLRLGVGNVQTHDDLKAVVCRLVGVVPDCEDALRIELTRISTVNWAMPATAAPCIDRDDDIEPATSYALGTPNDLMLVRLCLVQTPFNPLNGLGLRLPRVNESDFALVASSVFVNEP